MDINIDSQIVIQTAAQWAADTDVYSEKRILVTSDVYYTGTDQRKFKLANGVDTWSNLDYMPLGGSTTWGGITGTLSDQTDLQNALNNKQDLDSDLTAIAGLTPSNDDIIQRKAGSWINRTLAQLWVDLKDLTVTLTNKTLAVGSNSITGTASRVAQFGAGGSLEASSVTTTQLSYLDATSPIQTQLNNRLINLNKTATSSAVTGTTANTLLDSLLIPANTFKVGTAFIKLRNIWTTTITTKTTRIYINTSANLSGATLIGTYTAGSGANSIDMGRILCVKSLTSFEVYNSSATAITDQFLSGAAPSTITYDSTVDNYIIVAIQHGNTGESCVNSFINFQI